MSVEIPNSTERFNFNRELSLLYDQDLVLINGDFAVKYIKIPHKGYKLKLHLPKDQLCNIKKIDDEIEILPNPNSEYEYSILYINSLSKTESIEFGNYFIKPREVLTPEGFGVILNIKSNNIIKTKPINPESSYTSINNLLRE